jgi:hypothetical protein
MTMQTEQTEQTDVRPWYKEPFVWMLIGVPMSSVIVGSFFIYLAASTKDTLVRDNYYKDGLAINQELKWDKKAGKLDIKLSVLINDNTATIKLLSSRQIPPNTLSLKLSHPTLKERDRDSLLQLQENGEFKGFIDSFDDSRYYLMVESNEQQWRVRKNLKVIHGEVQDI